MGPYNKLNRKTLNKPAAVGNKDKNDNHPRYILHRNGLFLHSSGLWVETQTGAREFPTFGAASATAIVFRGCRVINLNPEAIVNVKNESRTNKAID